MSTFKMDTSDSSIHRRTFGLALLGAGWSHAAEPPPHTPPASTGATAAVAGMVKLLEGAATVTKAHPHTTHAVTLGMSLHEGDVIQTGKDAELHIVMDDGAYLAVRSETHVRLTRHQMTGQATDQAWLDLLKGALRYVSGWIGTSNPHAFRLQTPAATLGIRGTDFEVQHYETEDAPSPEEVGTHHLLHEGATVLATESGALDLEAGAAAYVLSRHERPLLHLVLPLFFRRRRGRFEGLIQQYAASLKEALLDKLQEKALLNPSETLQQRLERFREENPTAASNLNVRQVLQKIQSRREALGRPGSGGFGPNGAGRGGGHGGGRR